MTTTPPPQFSTELIYFQAEIFVVVDISCPIYIIQNICELLLRVPYRSWESFIFLSVGHLSIQTHTEDRGQPCALSAFLHVFQERRFNLQTSNHLLLSIPTDLRPEGTGGLPLP